MDAPELFEHKPVFFDSRGKRGKIFRACALILTTATTVVFLLFAVTLVINPFLPQIKLKPVYAEPEFNDAKASLLKLPPTSRHDAQLNQITEKAKKEERKRKKKKELATTQ